MNTIAYQQPERNGLSNASLTSLPDKIARPSYDRGQLSAGIVHIGVGNFHRAHQAWYLHRLMQQGSALNWAIIGAGVRPYDAVMREKLLAQDCLTSLIELDPSGTRAEITGAMVDYLPIDETNAPLIECMSSDAIRIVSLTVTEGGYFVDAATNQLDVQHPDIQHDAANPDKPRTAFGAMVAALKRRRDKGIPAFTALSCDNLQGNGEILRKIVLGLARLSDPALADWIAENGAFPNSMVDCIVPATGPQEIALARGLGLNDAAPVTHENFRQWVIEDKFCNGRPDWESVGAIFTDRVHDYEAMKIRILNAGHQVVANIGELLSVETIAECMRHPVIAAFFRKVQAEEIAPYVAPVPNMAPETYLELIEGRFANPSIKDTTRRVAFDGSSRHSGFVVPILRDALSAGASIDGLCLVEALWARMCLGTRETGEVIAPNDPHWSVLNDAAKAAQTSPMTWIEQKQFYGDLSENDRFAETFTHWLTRVHAEGSEAVVKDYLGI